jgi:hypothetical protein
MKEEYPEYFSSKDKVADNFEYIDISVGSYRDDFIEAEKIAKEKNGQVYTVIDTEGTSVVYEKGIHWVNRIGVVVLVKEEE